MRGMQAGSQRSHTGQLYVPCSCYHGHASLFVLFVPRPSAGDCWHCQGTCVMQWASACMLPLIHPLPMRNCDDCSNAVHDVTCQCGTWPAYVSGIDRSTRYRSRLAPVPRRVMPREHVHGSKDSCFAFRLSACWSIWTFAHAPPHDLCPLHTLRFVEVCSKTSLQRGCLSCLM